jgi:hypothetical protein
MVCRSWRAAAANCSGIHLLYVGTYHDPQDSFVAWLERGARQLHTLIIQPSYSIFESEPVMGALAAASAAALAAGTPLPLHTLRVLGYGPEPSHLGSLVASLPHLSTLQTGFLIADEAATLAAHLPALHAATQLQQLHWKDRCSDHSWREEVAAGLPSSLQRLSWEFSPYEEGLPDLSHLKQLTFLHLGELCSLQPSISHLLPPNLTMLEMVETSADLQVLQEQQQVLKRYERPLLFMELDGLDAWGERDAPFSDKIAVLSGCEALCLDMEEVEDPRYRPDLALLNNLSALVVKVGECCDSGSWPKDLGALLSVTGCLHTIRRLELRCGGTRALRRLASLSAVTHLKLSLTTQDSSTVESAVWAEEVSSMAGLRYLSVPSVVLQAGQGWLGGLQQLQVLVVQGGLLWDGPRQDVLWLMEPSPLLLPPQLLVMGVATIAGGSGTVLRQLRSHLRRRLAGCECEVVVGVDMDEVCDPTQQLAGLPVALRQALV